MKKIIILAGGISSRMKNSIAEISDHSVLPPSYFNKTKSMMPVGENNHPFMNYLLKNISAAGYKDAVIVTGSNDRSVIDYYSTKYHNNFYGLKLKYVEQPIPEGRTKPPGTSDAVLRVLDEFTEWQGGKFTVCNSDNLYSEKALAILLNSDNQNAMIDYDRSTLGLPQEKINKFAVTLKDENNFLSDIVEKPVPGQIEEIIKAGKKIGVSMNLWCFTYDEIYPYLLNTPLHPERNEKELPVTAKLLIGDKKFKIYAYPFCEEVPDLSTFSDIKTVSKYIDNLAREK